MTYRDRPILCPRCGLELERADGVDRWRCGQCRGQLWSTEEIIAEIVRLAPDLAPPDGPRGLTTLSRRTTDRPILCSQCAAPMDAVFLGGVEIDRCHADELMWFDRTELDRVRGIIGEQRADRDASWFTKLVKAIFE